MRSIQLILLSIVLFSFCSCAKNKTIAVDNKQETLMDLRKDTIIPKWLPGDTISMYRYLDYIAYYMKDSSVAIQMAQMDASKGAYFFMVFGLVMHVQNPDVEKERLKEKIRLENKIGIFEMGCEDSEIGKIYNREMKKLLKKNKGIDYDLIQ